MRRFLTGAAIAAAIAVLVPGMAAADLPDRDPDMTAPTIHVTVPSGAIDGWHKTAVSVRILLNDSHTGATGVSGGQYVMSQATVGSGTISPTAGATIQLNNEGSTIFDITATDRAGNIATARHYVGVDRQAPVVTVNPEAYNGAVYARNAVVPFSYSCRDWEVGVGSCTGSQTSGGHLATAALGSYMATVDAVDRLGNRRIVNINYLVVDPYFAVVAPPTVGGTARVGEHVRVTAPARFSPEPDGIDYQWRRDGQDIPGATAVSYLLAPEDLGTQISVLATARKTGFAPVTSTTAVGTIEPAQFQIARQPALTGTAQVGATLGVEHGLITPAPTTTSYQWYRDGAPIAGATGQSYRILGADAGSRIHVGVTVSRLGHLTATYTSAASPEVVLGVFAVSDPVSVTGTARVGEPLSAVVGKLTPTPQTLGYSWLRGATPIPGATSASYRPVAADVGARLSVRVTEQSPGYQPSVRVGQARTDVAPGVLTGIGQATVRGTNRVGAVLTAVAPSYAPAATIRYQWLRNGAVIPGATGRTYKAVAADSGRGLGVRVTASRSGYVTASSVSASTKPVLKASAAVRVGAKALGKRKVRITVTVTAAGVAPTGTVTVKRGSRTVARGVVLRGGKATVTLRKQPKGKKKVRFAVAYTGSTAVEARSGRTKAIRIR